MHQPTEAHCSHLNGYVHPPRNALRVMGRFVGNHSQDSLAQFRTIFSVGSHRRTLTRAADFDSDGLIPTSLFHSVLVSHRGRFVILNPSFPKTSRGVSGAPMAR